MPRKTEPAPTSKVCKTCGVLKPIEEFPEFVDPTCGRTFRRKFCNDCHQKRTLKMANRNSARMAVHEFNVARARMAAQCRYDPLLFAESAWQWGEGALAGKDIRAWQSEAMDTIAQHLLNEATRYQVCRIAVASGHGIGKSALTGMLTTWALACWRDPRIVITANTENQLLTKTSPEIAQWVKTSLYGDLFDCETMSIKYKAKPGQHRADLLTNSESNPEAFAGLHAEGRLVMMIVDEASGLSEVIYQTILGAMTDENTVLIFIMMGNPTSPTGPFREAFRKNRDMWNVWNVDSRTVEGTNKDALNDIVRQYGEDSDITKVRVRGIFPSVSQKQFIPTPYVDAAYGRHLRKEQYAFAPNIITCDPAWDGDDLLVIGHRQGLMYEELEVLEKNNNDMLVAAKLAHYEDRFDADAVFVDGGYGTGIVSAGLTMGREWTIVWFSEKPTTSAYKNKRAEMYDRARTWLASGGAIPKVQRLYDDLVAIETKPTVDGVIQLRSKEDMKKDGLPSPDHADAFALSFAHEVHKKLKATRDTTPVDKREVRILNEVFDPYEGE